jgi:peptide/nickel transport system substrate-binding protein
MGDEQDAFLVGDRGGLSRRELLARGAAVAGLLALGQPLTGAEAAVVVAGKEVDRLTWAITGDAVSLDYAFAYDFNTNVAMTNVTESLVRVTANGELEPHLAESFRQVDPLTWVYRLRRGVRFHDGSLMTPADVAYSLNRIGDPKVGSYLSSFHERVKNVAPSGPSEVTVKLKRPDTLWKYAAATQAAAVSKKSFLEKNGKKVGTPAVGIIGTGPYSYSSWTKGQQIVLDRFDGYWNKGTPHKVKQLVIKVIEDEATIVLALGTGEIDGTFSLSGKNIDAVKKFSSVRTVFAPSYTVHYLGLNTQRKPFSDHRVRQALSYAVDRSGMLDSVWGGHGRVTRSPVVPAMWTFDRDVFARGYSKLPRFDRNLDKARALINAAGAKGTTARVLIATNFDEQESLALQDAAKQIGLTINPNKIPIGDKVAREFSGKPRDYDMTISQWGSDVPDPAGNLQVPFLSTNLITNVTQYRNPKVDRLLEAQRAARNPGQRAGLLNAAQAVIVQEQPWVPFFSPNTTMALNKRVGGYKLRALYYWDPWAADIVGL